jgi:hypothetical protein
MPGRLSVRDSRKPSCGARVTIFSKIIIAQSICDTSFMKDQIKWKMSEYDHFVNYFIEMSPKYDRIIKTAEEIMERSFLFV